MVRGHLRARAVCVWRGMPQGTEPGEPHPLHYRLGVQLGLEVKQVKRKMATQWLGTNAGAVSLGKKKQGRRDVEIRVNCVPVIWKPSQAKFSKYRACMLIISLQADLGSLGAHSPAVWGIAEMGVGWNLYLISPSLS